jgi:bile acid-coenzyme A ligase
VQAMPIGALYRYHAERDPNRLCITCDGIAITRATFEQRTNQRARLYRDFGVVEGDFVTIALPNGIETFEAAAAIWKLGATPNAVSAKLPLPEFSAIVDLVRPRLVVGIEEGRLEGHRSVPADFGSFETYSNKPLPDKVPLYWKAMTSGGSTGRPKVIVDHMQGAYAPDAEVLLMLPDRTILSPGPLYHNMPFSLTNLALFTGNHIIVMPRFDPLEALRLLEAHRVDWVNLVPTMMNRIWMLAAEERTQFDLSALRVVRHGGAPCPTWLKDAWIAWLGAERVYEGYAATERHGGTLIRGDEWLSHRGSVGRPWEGYRLRILRADATDALPGEIGEIYFLPDEGPGSTYHYLGAEPRRIGGWESVGDLGHVDMDGYLYIADRRTDLIITGGANVYPAEIEAALDAHPSVGSSVAIGLPDDDLGQRVHAIVQLRHDVAELPTEASLKEFLQCRLAKYKLPRSIEFVHEPLRDDAGKVRRSQLRERRIREPAIANQAADTGQPLAQPARSVIRRD